MNKRQRKKYNESYVLLYITIKSEENNTPDEVLDLLTTTAEKNGLQVFGSFDYGNTDEYTFSAMITHETEKFNISYYVQSWRILLQAFDLTTDEYFVTQKVNPKNYKCVQLSNGAVKGRKEILDKWRGGHK